MSDISEIRLGPSSFGFIGSLNNVTDKKSRCTSRCLSIIGLERTLEIELVDDLFQDFNVLMEEWMKQRTIMIDEASAASSSSSTNNSMSSWWSIHPSVSLLAELLRLMSLQALSSREIEAREKSWIRSLPKPLDNHPVVNVSSQEHWLLGRKVMDRLSYVLSYGCVLVSWLFGWCFSIHLFIPLIMNDDDNN